MSEEEIKNEVMPEDSEEQEVNKESQSSSEPAAESCTDCQQYIDGWKRANADYANLKREMERKEQEWSKFASKEIILQLLPVIESWRKADESRPSPNDEGIVDSESCLKWIDGLGHVRSQLEKVLVKEGVTVIDEENVPFDPNLHEAMLTEKRDGVKADTVIKILEPGVKLHDRIIKPARVTVSE